MAQYTILKRLRILASVVYIALLTMYMLSVAFHDSPYGYWVYRAQLIPSIMIGAVLWMIFWAIVTITLGRVYCSTACPLGTLMDLFARIGLRLGPNKRYHYSPPRNGLRVPITILVSLCLYGSLMYAACETIVIMTDPYHMYHRMVEAVVKGLEVGIGSLTIATITFVGLAAVSWWRGRILCNTVCPVGGLLALMGRSPIYRVDINTDKCIHCGMCEDVCKAQCIDLRDCVVDNSRCVMCLNCTAVCPNDAITVRRGRYRLSDPMMQPTMRTDKQ